MEGSEANTKAQEATKKLMMERLAGRPDLQKQLIPDWSLGCRRLTPGGGYLEALCSEKCELLTGSIDEITETGIKMVRLARFWR